MIAALILAGGKIGEELQAVAGGATNKALIAVGPNGESMLELVVAAVRAGLLQCGYPTARVLIAGDVPIPPGCVAVAGGASLVDTLLSGASALRPAETGLLVVTADLPFLTADSVAAFVRSAEAIGAAQFVYPIVDAERCRARFPEMRRTTLRIAEGEFTGGNLALLDPAFLRKSESAIRGAYANRKNVGALAGMLGPEIILRFLLSRLVPGLLAIRHVEAAVGRLLNHGIARAVVTSAAEIGADVDRPEDVAIARRVLAAKPSNT